MPLYDFRCKKCKAKFEELVRSPREEESVRCAKCGSSKVARMMSVFATRSGSSDKSAPKRSGGSCSSGSCRKSCSSCCGH
jgi:putative FmdB family regulatory protein